MEKSFGVLYGSHGIRKSNRYVLLLSMKKKQRKNQTQWLDSFEACQTRRGSVEPNVTT